MVIERIDLSRVRNHDNTHLLSQMVVGESLFCDDAKRAESLRVLSYYLIRSRNLPWKFIFRKMDRGWRIIRVR